MFKQVFLIFAIIFFFGGNAARAQDATPTPAPSPSAVEAKPTAQTSPTPQNNLPPVDDSQKVQPENLQGVPVVAPNYKNDDTSLPELGRVGVDIMQQRPLSLNEAIAKALENNKDIEVSRQNVRLAEFDLTSARGFFDPRFTGQTYYERATLPNVSIFSTNKTTTTNSLVANAGFQAFVPKYGTIFNVTGNNTRLGSDNPISILSPQTNTSLTFSVTQPLFRGRRFDQPRRTIEIAKRNLSLTDTQFRQRSIDTITNVQRAYWDLVYNLRNLQVQRDSVKDAKDQLEHNRRLVEEGQLAPVDIIAAETQVANFEQNVYTALDDVSRSENTLKNLIADSRNDQIWSESIVPTDSIDLDAPRTTLPEALDLALQNRPEIEINKVQSDINAIDLRYLRDQTKPQVDLIASYTSAGIGGSQNPNFTNPFARVSACLSTETQAQCDARRAAEAAAAAAQQQAFLNGIGGSASTVSDIFLNRYPTVRAGVQFSLPLHNTTAKAQLGRALVQEEQIKTQREQVEQNIQVDVRNALQAVRTAELRTATLARENSEKQYASEQRKLDAGQSNIYQVLDRQTALTTARSQELRSQTDLNKSIADLQRATGNSLKANNVEARLRR